jgi:alpha-galactosidase
MDGMVSRKRTVNGVPTSLLDLGYSDVGLDDAWQLCGQYGPDKNTYHDETGKPVVDSNLFPDFKEMTDYAHSLSLTAGWYGNNCICEDHCKSDECYQEDVNALVAFGFDSVKLDGCGKEVYIR